MSMRKITTILLAAITATTVLAVPAAASDFPGNKQITIVCPYAAGGASDTTSRIFASEFEKAIGTTVVVQNTTGAGGAVGLET